MRHNLHKLPETEVHPGFHGRFVHTDTLTLAYWRVDEGATVPEHRHPQAQVVNVLEGEIAVTLDGVEHVLHPGDVMSIAPDTPHSARGLLPSLVLDVFNPGRDDYHFPL